jgi:predicted enzyme related to lactoylglutathione lyase
MSKIVHFEVPASDTGRAKEFWGSLFGVQFQSYEGPTEYHMFQNDDQTGGAVYQQQQGEQGLITYFNVDNIDSAKSKIEELGAVLAGDAAGRETPDEVTVFDSTGLAIQDLAIGIEVVNRYADRANDDRFSGVQQIKIG